MKIIDLLNKRAKGEEIPETFKYNDKIWRLASDRTYFIGSDYGYDFWVEHGDDKFEDEIITLNDEVEILEEEKKAPTLNNIRESYGLPRIEDKKIEKLNISNFPRHNNSLKKTAIKVNEIIDYLNSKGE